MKVHRAGTLPAQVLVETEELLVHRFRDGREDARLFLVFHQPLHELRAGSLSLRRGLKNVTRRLDTLNQRFVHPGVPHLPAAVIDAAQFTTAPATLQVRPLNIAIFGWLSYERCKKRATGFAKSVYSLFESGVAKKQQSPVHHGLAAARMATTTADSAKLIALVALPS